MQLNLTRRWRSKRFDELVGQDLVVKLVKNSLYRNFLFPVYLLSGTRGCGKTSMGRLFAAALNCSELENFQANPKSVNLPCLECFSCKSMQKGEHPDFIEIDAASHTGVDNIRKIIESAAYVPVLGNKKIFLVDEAHMLSKAAFNALLKVLEEPPKCAVFMLATTDPHKILDTVKSRCFQLFFQPVDPQVIANHLSNICNAENIKFDEEALLQIALSSEGSLRDAINILERLRLANTVITKKLVLEVLGFLDDSKLCSILQACISKDSSALLDLINKFNLDQFDAQLIWKKLVELLRTLVWANQNIDSSYISYVNKEELKSIARQVPLDLLINMLDMCYSYESFLQRTSTSSIMLETLFLSLASLGSEQNLLKKNLNKPNSRTVAPIFSQPSSFNESSITISNVSNANNEDNNSFWSNFLKEAVEFKDSLLVSIFKQSKYKKFDKDKNILTVILPKSLEFFKEELESNKNIWQPVLNKCYNKEISLEVSFDISKENLSLKKINKLEVGNSSNKLSNNQNNKVITKPVSYGLNLNKDKTLDFSSKENWPKTNLLLQYFPGIVSEVRGLNE